MFKSARWRSEKNKIKAVFKLQFHATSVSDAVGGGGDGLMISVVPADVGKPTVKLDKATFRDGSCYWDTPVLKTVKFVREPKTGKIHERIYHFLWERDHEKLEFLWRLPLIFLVMLWLQRFLLYLFPSRIQNQILYYI